MEEATTLVHRKWQWLSILGLDVALFALMWGQCYVVLLDIPVVTEEPFLFLAISVWLSIMLTRLVKAIGNRPFVTRKFYAKQMGLIAVILLGVAMALFWITFYYVSVQFLRFIVLPCASLLLANIPLLKRLEFISILLKSMALSMICIAPAMYFMVTVSPLEIALYPPVYYLALLIFFFEITRVSIVSRDKVQRARYSLMTTVGLIFLLIVCLSSANVGMLYERGLYYSLIVGCAAVEVISRLRSRVSTMNLYALSWLIFALAPALSLYLF